MRLTSSIACFVACAPLHRTPGPHHAFLPRNRTLSDTRLLITLPIATEAHSRYIGTLNEHTRIPRRRDVPQRAWDPPPLVRRASVWFQCVVRILFQLIAIKPGDSDVLSVALETIAASHRAGHQTAVFLAGDSVMISQPEKYMTNRPVNGLPAPAGNVRWLLGQGVPFYAEKNMCAAMSIPGTTGVLFVTLDQLAIELANFDKVLVYAGGG